MPVATDESRVTEDIFTSAIANLDRLQSCFDRRASWAREEFRELIPVIEAELKGVHASRYQRTYSRDWHQKTYYLSFEKDKKELFAEYSGQNLEGELVASEGWERGSFSDRLTLSCSVLETTGSLLRCTSRLEEIPALRSVIEKLPENRNWMQNKQYFPDPKAAGKLAAEMKGCLKECVAILKKEFESLPESFQEWKKDCVSLIRGLTLQQMENLMDSCPELWEQSPAEIRSAFKNPARYVECRKDIANPPFTGLAKLQWAAGKALTIVAEKLVEKARAGATRRAERRFGELGM